VPRSARTGAPASAGIVHLPATSAIRPAIPGTAACRAVRADWGPRFAFPEGPHPRKDWRPARQRRPGRRAEGL